MISVNVGLRARPDDSSFNVCLGCFSVINVLQKASHSINSVLILTRTIHACFLNIHLLHKAITLIII